MINIIFILVTPAFNVSTDSINSTFIHFLGNTLIFAYSPSYQIPIKLRNNWNKKGYSIHPKALMSGYSVHILLPVLIFTMSVASLELHVVGEW